MRIRTAFAAAALATVGLIGGSGAAMADSGAQGAASDSPGIVSGNTIQLPIELDANVCGNSINVLGALNPVTGNFCGDL